MLQKSFSETFWYVSERLHGRSVKTSLQSLNQLNDQKQYVYSCQRYIIIGTRSVTQNDTIREGKPQSYLICSRVPQLCVQRSSQCKQWRNNSEMRDRGKDKDFGDRFRGKGKKHRLGSMKSNSTKNEQSDYGE